MTPPTSSRAPAPFAAISTTRTRRAPAATLFAGLALATSIASAAQPTPSPAPGPAPTPASTPSTPSTASTPATSAPGESDMLGFTPAEQTNHLARAIARIALVDLRLAGDASPATLRVAQRVLDIAHRVDPSDAEILRLLIEAATQAGDDAAAQQHLRTLVRLDPADTVATLAAISGRLSALQRVEDRLAAYDRFLGPQGAALDASVRSRLALDAAMLARERGDADLFLARLRQALALDATNKDAAAVLVAFVSGSDDAPAARLEAQIILLNADPLDARAHLAVARELAASGIGASEAALRFYANTVELRDAFAEALPRVVEVERLVEVWRTRGATAVASDIASSLRTPRAEMARAIERARAAAPAGAAPAAGPSPDDLRLTADIEQLWLLAADASGDAAGADEALAELVESLRRAELATGDEAQREPGDDEAAAREKLQARRLGLLWLRLLVGRQIDQAESDLRLLQGDESLRGPGLARIAGWLALRRGDTVVARSQLTRAAAQDPLAELGLAMLQELDGDLPGAGALYARLARTLAGTPEGAWAQTRAERLLQRPLEPDAQARQLAAMARGVPAFVDQMIRDPRRFMQLSVEPVSSRLHPLGRTALRVRLRNAASIPLALGADKPLNTRMLLSPRAEVGSQAVRAVTADVLSLERRLRLLPREELAVDIWAEPGFSGWLLEMSAGELARVRYRVVQGFRFGGEKGTQAGPLSLSVETGTVIRQALTGVALAPADLAQTLRDAQGPAFVEAVASARWRFFRDQGGLNRLAPEDVAALTAALSQRYLDGDRLQRLTLLAMLPSARYLPRLDPFEQTVRSAPETDADVLALRAVTRGLGPDDAAIKALRGSDSAPDTPAASPAPPADPLAAALAAALADALEARLQMNALTYATMAMGAVAPAPPPAPAPPASPAGSAPATPPPPAPITVP